MDDIREIDKKINYSNLTYCDITPGIRPIYLIEFRGSLDIFKVIENGDKAIETAEKEQIKLKSKSGKITSGNPKHKLQNQEVTIENVQNLSNLRQKVIDLFNDYSKIRSKAIYEIKQSNANKETSGLGLKILTSKQMLQRLPIVLVQVKPGNNSENLLNEIRQIVYSLHQSKEIT